MATLDCHGRIADRAVLHAVDWPAGHRLTIQEAAGRLTVTPDPAGDHQVTGQGHVRIPALLRHRCGLATACCWPPTPTGLAWPSTHLQPWTSPFVRPPTRPAVAPNDPAHRSQQRADRRRTRRRPAAAVPVGRLPGRPHGRTAPRPGA